MTIAAGTIRRYAAAIAVVLAVAVPVARAQKATPMRGVVQLSDLRDGARPLLIFASKPDDAQLQIQLQILQEHAPGIAERDIVVIALPYNNPSPTATSMTSAEADTTRRRFHVAPPDFTVILVGKDGGEKLRSRKPISFEKLRNTIDAMPMRQQEMQRQCPSTR